MCKKKSFTEILKFKFSNLLKSAAAFWWYETAPLCY